MADITLSNGREITFDLACLSLREFRGLFDKTQPQEAEDKIIAKVCGMTADEYLDLPYEEWKRILVAFFKRARSPVGSTDPN